MTPAETLKLRPESTPVLRFVYISDEKYGNLAKIRKARKIELDPERSLELDSERSSHFHAGVVAECLLKKRSRSEAGV